MYDQRHMLEFKVLTVEGFNIRQSIPLLSFNYVKNVRVLAPRHLISKILGV